MSQRILLAESKSEILELAASTLKGSGYDILTATSGLQALRQAGTGQPDLIVLAFELPDINGAVVCDIMRKLPSTSDIPIILLTDQAEAHVRNLGLEWGANACISKPFS